MLLLSFMFIIIVPKNLGPLKSLYGPLSQTFTHVAITQGHINMHFLRLVDSMWIVPCLLFILYLFTVYRIDRNETRKPSPHSTARNGGSRWYLIISGKDFGIFHKYVLKYTKSCVDWRKRKKKREKKNIRCKCTSIIRRLRGCLLHLG